MCVLVLSVCLVLLRRVYQDPYISPLVTWLVVLAPGAAHLGSDQCPPTFESGASAEISRHNKEHNLPECDVIMII